MTQASQNREFPPGFSKSVELPGEAKTGHKTLLEMGSDVLQSFTPINNIHFHLCGIHTYAGEANRQVEAHHFCGHLTDDFCQCIIFDGCERDSRLIGIEYIISEKVFRTLPEEEKRFWHSHVYEVTSGLLLAPNLPLTAEKSAMKSLVNTYGKTFHTWQIDKGHNLPLGPPQLMMSPTRDGIINPGLIELRDKNDKLVEKTADRAKNRSDIVPDPVLQGADDWEKGKALQCTMQEVDVQGVPPQVRCSSEGKPGIVPGTGTTMPVTTAGSTCDNKPKERCP